MSFKELVDKLDDWRTFGFVKKMKMIDDFKLHFKKQTDDFDCRMIEMTNLKCDLKDFNEFKNEMWDILGKYRAMIEK